ncbi:outer membrane protein assembly factor BamE [Propylenella binzhouense]|uniref:Outer membrane protein assembly factor BamE n=1 Tax=Propylenella binzhouense TaxID=2555902 RepID=A0A964T6T6_9HYPH|nr:outer membrane protein assembly factor BamE [Propylenella binzhouense]MYZ48477.1 outer membrane protein assembly factor BamE [Propylenella binzhouense]
MFSMIARTGFFKTAAAAATLFASTLLTGCIGETFHRGYVMSQTAIEQVPIGAPREQVLVALGTPSTTADFGGEAFYYISQTASRPVAFMNPHIVDQHVLAVYFDENQQVRQIADYGLKDGRVFDFVAQTTPTAGKDFSFISQLLSAAGNFGAVQ